MTVEILIETEVDADLNDRASSVLATMGLTVSDAIVMLLNKIAEDGAVPADFAADAAKRDDLE